MSGGQNAVITGLGLVSPVGLGLAQSCASVRAGINRFKECEFYVCQSGPPDYDDEPLIGSVAPSVKAGPDRIGALALAAVQDLVRNSRLKRSEFVEAGLYFSLPPAGRPTSVPRHAAGSLADLLGLDSGAQTQPRVHIEEGHTGGLRAVQEAVEAIQEGRNRSAIVVGADSWFDDAALAWADGARRLKCSATPNGFVPGEAAAAVLIESTDGARQREAKVLATIETTGVARETDTVLSGKVCTGKGLAEAIGPVSADDDGFDWVACDLNGEPYRSIEWGHCQVKLNKLFASLRHIWHPADCLGDVGAASGTALMAIVSRAFERGYARSERCLVWTSADEGERAALVLKRA